MVEGNDTTIEASIREDASKTHDMAKAELMDSNSATNSADENEKAPAARKEGVAARNSDDEEFQDCLDEVQFAKQFERPAEDGADNDDAEQEENKKEHSGSSDDENSDE